MSGIESFRLTRLHNNEHHQFMTDVNILYNTHGAETLGIAAFTPQFELALANEEVAMRVEQGNILSKTIGVQDKLRDRTWRAINARMKSMLLSPSAEEVESGRVILRIIDKYGNIRGLSYNDGSAAINNLVNDLLLPENDIHMERMGIAYWVGQLKEQNELCQSLLNQRNVDEAQKADGNVGDTRKVIDPIYESMVSTINAMLVLGTASAAAITFAGQLNEQIGRYRTTVNLRAARGKKDEVETTP